MLDKLANHQFVSTKIQQNTLFPHLFTHSDNDYIASTISLTDKSPIDPPREQQKQAKQQDVCDLQDMWNSIEAQRKQIVVKKVEIASIFDEPQTLTAEQMEAIFGNQAEPIPNQQEEGEDLGQLWDLVQKQQPSIEKQSGRAQIEQQHHQRMLNQTQKQLKQIEALRDHLKCIPNQTPINKANQPQNAHKPKFFEVEEKETQKEGRTCLTLGKDFAIYDYSSFLTNCFSQPVYCYFGFRKTQHQKYVLFDLTTGHPLMVCIAQKYVDFTQSGCEQRRIEYEKNYCLRMRMGSSEEIVATIWQKQISNGLLYNIRHYNPYEGKHDESVALIEITDSYIGNNCYCNTNVFISPKFSTQPGQLKMKLSLKNGYLIANMGVSGIKSAPYNCRLENPSNSFVYLLGLLEKEQEKFIVRVGQGISPVIAFAIAIGRKRYIDSFKQ